MSESANREILNQIDESIRQGQTRRAAARIQALCEESSRLPRKEKLELARLARRAFIPALGILLLRPFVRPSASTIIKATPEERLEFAACLIWLGARSEGRELLAALDPATHPERDLFTSFALFSSWDYGAAVPLLRRYVRHPALAPYARLVGKANLAAALVHERLLPEARELLAELEAATRDGGHALLLRNILKLEAERAVYARDLARADRALGEALALAGSSPDDALFVEKWRAIARSDTAALHKIKREFLEMGEWEGVRDCDYHLSLLTKDLALGARLYAGTPYPRYRERFLGDFRELRERLPERFCWELGADSQRVSARDSVIEFSVPRGCGGLNDELLKPGQVPHRLLSVLASDFYRPFNLVELHSAVFPAKHYHPEFSADSMHQALRRLRAYLRRVRLPLQISENGGNYRLQAARPMTLWVGMGEAYEEKGASVKLEREATLLERRFLATEFTAEDAARALQLSRNSAIGRLRELSRLERVQKLGQGPATRYRFPSGS
ncbi:MAG: hypothetical protein NDJ89_03415 [Oligoflexia bacterium]|nr:hypothetical protein [Oligoflexia bacterium]